MKNAATQTRPEGRRGEAAGDDYACRVVFRAPREQVFDATTTAAGIRGWWTTIVSGSGVAGGELRLEFKGLDEYIVLLVDKADRPSSAQWSCVVHTGLPEWYGTRVVFDLVERAPGECALNFRHIGLTPALSVMTIARSGGTTSWRTSSHTSSGARGCRSGPSSRNDGRKR